MEVKKSQTWEILVAALILFLYLLLFLAERVTVPKLAGRIYSSVRGIAFKAGHYLFNGRSVMGVLIHSYLQL
jgi:hypothetical protein